MDIPSILLLMLLCLVVEGFFSGSEIGVVSADQMKLRHEAAKGSRGAKLAMEMLKKPEWLLSTTLVGTNIAIVTNTSLATLLAIRLFGPEQSWIAIMLAAPLIWIFGEIVPKSIFQQNADYLTPRIIYVLKGASYLFFPLLFIFATITKIFTKLLGGNRENPFTLREELQMMLQEDDGGGDILPVEKAMIRRMFHFGETRVRDVAVPLVDVVSISESASCGEALSLGWEKSHTRIPVYQGRVYQMVGFINCQDLMNQDEQTAIKPFIRPVRFVPGAMRIESLFLEFHKEGKRVAMVVDEYGAAEGMITLEDIMERIVGEMEDEYDVKEDPSRVIGKLGEGRFLLNPRIDLIALEEELGIHLADGNYETLAGFLLEKARDIPKVGEVIRSEGVTFRIQKVSKNAILEVEAQL
ncbi:MAG: HlyC/CorC family transporter [Magnetococcales bacterium]|nr:HlyC/CorC family transporter [Magnetococcales bacterium]